MLSDDVLGRIEREPRVWVTTLRPDGSPHTTPVWFVVHDDRWWFASAATNVKVRNLRADDRVSLALEDGARPVVVEGRARLVDGAPDDVARAFAGKYGGWDVAAEERPGVPRVLVEVVVTRWLLTGAAW